LVRERCAANEHRVLLRVVSVTDCQESQFNGPLGKKLQTRAVPKKLRQSAGTSGFREALTSNRPGSFNKALLPLPWAQVCGNLIKSFRVSGFDSDLWS